MLVCFLGCVVLGFFDTKSVFLSLSTPAPRPLPPEGVTDNSAKKMERRNDDQAILNARARYLERKQQRAQGLSGPLKELG